MVRATKLIASVILAGTLLHVFHTFYQYRSRASSVVIVDSPPPPPTFLSTPPPPPFQSSSSAAASLSLPPRVKTPFSLLSPSPPPPPRTASKLQKISSSSSVTNGCGSKHITRLLSLECNPAKAAAAAADEAADSATLQRALRNLQNPTDCSSSLQSRQVFTFKDWRNGLGAQLSTLVGVWAAVLHKESSGSSKPLFDKAHAPLLLPLGGLRYANKALCPKRDLSCYFEPFSKCDEPPDSAKKARAAKTPPELAARVTKELKLRRPRDKWWFRKELTRYVFRLNAQTQTMLSKVREEMGLQPPKASPQLLGGGGGSDSSNGGSEQRLRTDQLIGLHVRRGDKRDLGAKERGEPFSDAMYVSAAKALADELGAEGFLLASSEPETLKRLPPLLKPRPTYVMPDKYFVHVPEGLTPHQVIEKTKQEGGENDEGRSQIVQLLLLSECLGFLGTVTSNFGLLVTKLMAFNTPSPMALDLSCAGLAPMQAPSSGSSSSDAGGKGGKKEEVPVWRFELEPKDARRCKGYGRHEDIAPRKRGG